MGGGIQRKLAAIVVADIVGYSRLMAADEEGTLERLRHLRDGLVDPTITEHGGRIVKRTGDGSLVEFPSIVDAVRASLRVQEKLTLEEVEQDESRRIVLRIGVNLGDIIIEDDDIFGDGVNIAARLEQLCAPGEVMISGAAYDQLEGRDEFTCRDLGEQHLKNIPRPVRAYRLMPNDERDTGANSVSMPDERPMAQPLPEKPSIVVLPFTNMSSDPDQEFFCDGISEDITTALSRFQALFVIARNTAFTFKGRAQNVREVSRELGVQYVLEGSVRRAGNRIRITAQLIDAINDRHVWANKYDRDVDDLFAVQDEITRAIVMAVAPEIRIHEIDQISGKAQQSLKGWERIARASWLLMRFGEADNEAAQEILAAAIDENPRNADAFALKAQGYVYDGFFAWSRAPAESLRLAMESAQKAIEIDPDNEEALITLAMVLSSAKRHGEAVEHLERALALNPNHPKALGALGLVLTYLRDERADEYLQTAIRYGPKEFWTGYYLAHRGLILFFKDEYEDALALFEEAHRIAPTNISIVRAIAAAQALAGLLEKAKATYGEFRKGAPNVTLATTRQTLLFHHEEDTEKYIEGLRRAGMPE